MKIGGITVYRGGSNRTLTLMSWWKVEFDWRCFRQEDGVLTLRVSMNTKLALRWLIVRYESRANALVRRLTNAAR